MWHKPALLQGFQVRVDECCHACAQVYEHLVFEGSHHKSLRTFPGMADRTVRVGSAGKTFSFTAWKVRQPHIFRFAHADAGEHTGCSCVRGAGRYHRMASAMASGLPRAFVPGRFRVNILTHLAAGCVEVSTQIGR